MAKFLIVEARFYGHLNAMLIAGARGALEAAGHAVEVVSVPGALEVPGAIALAAESGRYDGFVGLGVSIYHYIVPRAVTIWQAAAPAQSQVFMLIGVVIILPMILAYTSWAYWVFRGKVGAHCYH